MDKKQLKVARAALEEIALKEKKTVTKVRKEITKAMLIGMLNPDPQVQAFWNRIPHQADVPTPEEVIAFLASKSKGEIR